MSRLILGIICGLLVILGVVGLIGHSAGWSNFIVPIWLSWSEIMVGIVAFIATAADTK